MTLLGLSVSVCVVCGCLFSNEGFSTYKERHPLPSDLLYNQQSLLDIPISPHILSRLEIFVSIEVESQIYVLLVLLLVLLLEFTDSNITSECRTVPMTTVCRNEDASLDFSPLTGFSSNQLGMLQKKIKSDPRFLTPLSFIDF